MLEVIRQSPEVFKGIAAGLKAAALHVQEIVEGMGLQSIDFPYFAFES